MTVQVRRTYTHTTCVTYVRHHAWSPTPMCTALRVKERRPRPRLPLKQRIPHSFSRTHVPSLARLPVLADDDIFIRASDMARGN